MSPGSLLPLSGQRVVLTRAARQAEPMRRAFRDAGAEVVCLPLLVVVEPEDPARLRAAAARTGEFSWIAFTSSNAVVAFFNHSAATQLPPLAAVGPATAAALAERGHPAALIPRIASAAGLAKLLGPRVSGQRVLIPQAADARPDLAAALTSGGAMVETVTAYDKRVPAAAQQQAEQIFGAGNLGWVTFTSPRIARHFRQLFGSSWQARVRSLKAASIGPVTSGELRSLGVSHCYQAAAPSATGLVDRVVKAIQTS